MFLGFVSISEYLVSILHMSWSVCLYSFHLFLLTFSLSLFFVPFVWFAFPGFLAVHMFVLLVSVVHLSSFMLAVHLCFPFTFVIPHTFCYMFLWPILFLILSSLAFAHFHSLYQCCYSWSRFRPIRLIFVDD